MGDMTIDEAIAKLADDFATKEATADIRLVVKNGKTIDNVPVFYLFRFKCFGEGLYAREEANYSSVAAIRERGITDAVNLLMEKTRGFFRLKNRTGNLYHASVSLERIPNGTSN